MAEPVHSLSGAPDPSADSAPLQEDHVEPHVVADRPAELAAGFEGPREEPGALENNSEEEELGSDLDEETRLKLLVTTRDQDELERDIGRQANQMLTEQADERDKKRLEKTQANKQKCESELRRLKQRLAGPGGSTIKNKIRADIVEMEARTSTLSEELRQIQARIEERHKVVDDTEGTVGGDASHGPLPGETRRDFLIRTGKITPFSKMAQVPRVSANLGDVMFEAEAGEQDEDDGMEEVEKLVAAPQGPVSHRDLMRPGFLDEDLAETSCALGTPLEPGPKRRKVRKKARGTGYVETPMDSESAEAGESDDAFVPDMDDRQLYDFGESEDEEDADFSMDTIPAKRKAHGGTRKRPAQVVEDEKEDLAGVDDGNEKVYQARLESWVKKRSEARRRAKARGGSQSEDFESLAADRDGDPEEGVEEWFRSHPTRPDAQFEGGFRIPGDIYPSLFDYQKTCVQWLWELYSQGVGGIIGDEMGLGKTIQIISFLAGMHYSDKLTKPIIVVCPATVMKQWVNEFHRWWPPMRVSILHTSGSGMMNVRQEGQLERELESRKYDGSRRKATKAQRAAKKILDKVKDEGHVLITTYSGLQTYAELLIPTDWEYAVLDEGHKIRNPDTGITIYCKELRTANRIILSGTPMQNNLIELWSLFDFIFPMRLGTLVDFKRQFEFPIKQGGYASASNLQVETAMRCAETLKETISPYLLQRFKVDVAADLPKKSERVLFCKLTKLQRDYYRQFLRSGDMESILAGKRQALFGIDILRKICNHPDLVEHKRLSKKSDYKYGASAKSGKMQVVKALLEMWKKDGHKTLLFAQHRIMLDILEEYVKSIHGINFRRMDGTTAIKARQDLVDEFNRDPDLHVFLLTTKVGGLGVNLTGADRVIIYDPDWNPSTDMQARERAWRLGQQRDVEIYRLMTAGTIEEKIYHRQIFKQFLTNKILKDPKQRQTFQLRDLHDLFTFNDGPEGQTETGSMFKGAEVKFSDGDRNEGSYTVKTERPSEDVAEISGVAHEEAYQPDGESAAPAPENGDEASRKDDRLLSTIFARSGVHSALEHDAILASSNGKKKITADPEIITREAKRIAAEAAAELKRTGEIARTVPIGTPTWTGAFGTTGRPEPRRSMFAGRGRGVGPSSSSVLANLAARQPATSFGGLPTPPATVSSRSSTPQAQPRGREFLTMIRDFLLAHGGQVYTQMLIDHFNRYCGTPQRTAEFKEMLKRIAVLEKGRQGRGKWVLKDEFRRDGSSRT